MSFTTAHLKYKFQITLFNYTNPDPIKKTGNYVRKNESNLR